MIGSIHERLYEARRRHRQSEFELSRLLFTLHSTRAYREKGHSSTVQYADVELDLTSRQTRTLLAIGQRARDLPHLTAALAAGELDYTKAREVIRVATPETDEAWTRRALDSSSRELEAQVSASSPGERPPGPDDLPLRPRRARVVLEMEAAEADLFWRAVGAVRRSGEFDEQTEDGAIVADLARQFLAQAPATVPQTAERYRVVVQLCPSCQVAHSRGHEVSEALLGEAACDAEVLVCNAAITGPLHRGTAYVGRSEAAGIDVAHSVAAGTHVGQSATDTTHACHRHGETTQAGDRLLPALVPPSAKVGRLARQVPRATRRAVFERHGDRCAVPSCRSRTWVDLHHIRPRHQGGRHEAANLVPICSLHHRLLHENRLLAARTAEGVRFFLPDGTPFGARPRGDDPCTRPEFADAMLQLLDAEPLHRSQIERPLGLSEPHVARLLSMLRARGQVFERPTGEWARVDRLLPGAPTWVTRQTISGTVS